MECVRIGLFTEPQQANPSSSCSARIRREGLRDVGVGLHFSFRQFGFRVRRDKGAGQEAKKRPNIASQLDLRVSHHEVGESKPLNTCF